MLIGRVGHIIAITPRLRDDLIAQRGASPQRVLVAHDGFRRERFAQLPQQSSARALADWPNTAFIVGFVGRLHMLNVDKGVGTLVEAAAQIPGVYLALVGGPAEMADRFRQQWLTLGQDDAHFLYTGQVAPDDVPRYLRAFDVCAMPHPFTEQFAYYTSPLKLFEYMAAGRAVIASDLPGWSDVLRHEQNALLIPPGDVMALAEALQRLKADAALRTHLAETAQQEAFAHYTWQARAERIRQHLQRENPL
jgi:glycosyltransferase involved in cell wall biosynthesis